MDLRIIFMGTAPLACSSLKLLVRQPEWKVAAVVTQPDRPKGRNLSLQFSAVKEVAISEGLSVLQPERARNPEFLIQLAELRPDLIVVAAYGQILPQSVLDLPRFGCLNVHTSLLPKYRGAAPIQWAILEDQPETGVTLMKMDAGLDTGDILSTVSTPITPEDNAQSLHDRLAQLGAELLVKTIPNYVFGTLKPVPQPAEGATYARKISKEDGHLSWGQPARVLWNRVRALTPWPGAFTHLAREPKPVLLKIWESQVAGDTQGTPGHIIQADKNGIVVACKDGGLRLTVVQKEGGRRMTAQEFLAGHSLKSGDCLA
ncbi:MAG TPA: methionyl-tRNA formyltransferase [Candidatus Saccharimonadales bacterium]|nr:methionyl-tRNA formyltransferase [Candidatus Saccharimonadales bacterium]